MAAVVAALLLAGAAFAQEKVLSRENAYYIYLKGTKKKITENEYLNYAKVVESQIYKKYKNDEFEWEDQFTSLKQKFDKAIVEADLDSTYVVVTAVDFGNYDFTNEGFSVSIDKNTYFKLYGFSERYEASKDSVFRNHVAYKLIGFEKYNFFAMPKADAKIFLQGRKDSYGDVNREVTLQIFYKIAKFDSKEYKTFADWATTADYLPIVGTIEKIEVFDASDSHNVKKIGELVSK